MEPKRPCFTEVKKLMRHGSGQKLKPLPANVSALC